MASDTLTRGSGWTYLTGTVKNEEDPEIQAHRKAGWTGQELQLPEAQHVFYRELNREAGLLHKAEQEGVFMTYH